MTTDYYIQNAFKIEKNFDDYLQSVRGFLSGKYGEGKTSRIIFQSRFYYYAVAKHMPYFNSKMYDQLIVTCASMMVLKKGMKDVGIGVEEFVATMIDNFRETKSKIPKSIRTIGGKVFLSKIMRTYLVKVGNKVTQEGWPTEVISGTKNDDFEMKVCTRDCQMLAFIKAIGEEDLVPYCSFFDFANAESLGYSLKQTTTIDSGVCTFCFNKKGEVHWPDSFENIFKN